MARKLRVLPTQVYVWEIDIHSDAPYYAVDASLKDVPHGALVGIYELRETRTKRVVHELEDEHGQRR